MILIFKFLLEDCSSITAHNQFYYKNNIFFLSIYHGPPFLMLFFRWVYEDAKLYLAHWAKIRKKVQFREASQF